MAKSVRILPDRDPEFVTIFISGKESKAALACWANLYGKEILEYMREVQRNEAAFANDALKERLKGLQVDMEAVAKQMAAFTTEANVVDFDRAVDAFVQRMFSVELKFDEAKLNLETTQTKIQRLEAELQRQGDGNDQLQAEQQKLEALLKDYTDKHAFVIRQREIIENLKKKGALAGNHSLGAKRLPATSLGHAIYLQLVDLGAERERLEKLVKHFEQLKAATQTDAKGLSQKNVEYGLLKARYKSLETLRNSYDDKQRHAQMLQDSGLGYFRIFSPATPGQVNVRKRWMTVFLLTVVGGMMGALTAALVSVLAEAVDGRIKTGADLRRISRLPLLATLGDLRQLSPSEQVAWAFRTLTILQGKLNIATDQTLVCGFISSRHGEGRSTWINLLTSAASQRGLRVLTVATRPVNAPETAPEPAPAAGLLPVQPSTTLSTNVLMAPAQVTEQFSDPKAQPIVHIPLPGWVWNLERRKQWSIALEQWSKIENLILLVELPPATQPEAVLLAEHLPQVIWLACCGIPGTTETMHQIETLRHARVNLVGTVLNREPSSILKTRFASWMRGFAFAVLGLGWGTAQTLMAEPTVPDAANLSPRTQTNLSFSISPSARAAWQQRLTLGPGDALDFAFLGKPELARTNIVIDPNGRINYLQLQDFPAAELTVDELRAKVDQALAEFYRTPRVMITPAAFSSKKYFLLGKVAGKGVYVMDRPLTIIEAVARAKGLETGLIGANTVDMADLSRSFLVRNGQKIALDLERLFHQGDLSQNIALEPNDYVYFAPNSMNEVYVLGEVLSPGIAPYLSQTGLVAALASRGGFTQRAYRKKVLVIRGSLNHPETFVVDAAAVLRGKTPDFKLEPRDIVYINARPWIKVEELIDIGIQSFIEGAVTGWAAGNIGPLFRRPILPQL